jgi:hypothetical protein
MPTTQVTRQRVLGRDTCILGFSGNALNKSYVFDATTLTPDVNGFYYPTPFSFVTPSVTNDPTKIKVYQGLGTNVNAVQTLTETGAPTGGTFTLTFNGQTTAPIPYNATSTQVQNALTALSNVGSSQNVAVAGGPINTAAVTVSFQGLYAHMPVATMGVNYSLLTGGTAPAVTDITTTTGQTAESIIGVFDNIAYDLLGNAAYDDEPMTIYNQYTAFDTTKLSNWYAYGPLAIAALPTCTFN